FRISVIGRTCADLGSSTGGFTELLLARGAAKVFAVDTAVGELAWKLRSDPRVECWEGINAASLPAFPEPIDFMTIDISLLPLRMVLPSASAHLEPGGELVVLVKPQYELDAADVPA